jgi:HEAT repeat protein
MGTPIYRLWYKKQWSEDEKYGPTLHTRLEELSSLREGADMLNDVEKERVASELSRALADDPCSIYRAEAVRTLGALGTPAATEGLQRALGDKEASVRIAACRAWGQRGGQESLDALSRVLGKDADVDVRTAAARELASFKDPAVIPALGLALDDPDPALQYQVVESLEEVTGKDFGNSVPAWRQYVRDGTVQPREEISIAERLRNLF